MAISALLHYFYSDGDSDLAIIVFFIAILDLSNVLKVAVSDRRSRGH